MQYVLFDTNLLFFLLFDIRDLDKAKAREQVLARITRELIRPIFKREDCVLLVPNFILGVEIPRAVARMVIVKNLVSEDKIPIVVSKLKSARNRLEKLQEYGVAEVVNSWTASIFKRASWLYRRFSNRKPSLAKKIGHQDFVVIAVAMLHNAGVVTADKDLREIAEVCEIGTPVYYFEVMRESVRVHLPVNGQVPCIDEIAKQLCMS